MGEVRFVNVAGTDAILKIEKAKNKDKEAITKIYPISKTELMEYSIKNAFFDGFMISSMFGLWLLFFSSLAMPLIATLTLVGIPVFAILAKAFNNFLISKQREKAEPVEEDDEGVFENPEAMPVFDFDEELFTRSGDRIIEAYKQEFYNYKKLNRSTLENSERSETVREEDYQSMVRDKTFTKVFYGDTDTGEHGDADTIADAEIEETLRILNDTQKSENDEQSIREVEEDVDAVKITDKRSVQNDNYFKN